MSDATEERGGRAARRERLGWSAVALLLVALAVPWFLWRDATVVAGLPLWIWWHVGWMVLASGVFYVFARRGWGVGVLPRAARRPPTPDENGRSESADGTEVNRRG